MGRALMAKGDVNAATGELEAAVSGGYGAAQIDLGDLLLRELIPGRAKLEISYCARPCRAAVSAVAS